MNDSPSVEQIQYQMAAKGVTEVVNRCEKAKVSGFLDLTGCGLVAIPQSVYFLVREFEIHSCSLRDNELTKFPKKLPAKLNKLRLLSLSGNKLEEIPEEIQQLTYLKSLDLSKNKMATFPYEVTKLPELESLNLEANCIAVGLKMADVKNILYSWAGKRKLGPPVYDVQTQNAKGRTRFRCEVRLEGYDYVAMGNSTNKKDSQTNAARDFCQHLVLRGDMDSGELPAFEASAIEASGGFDGGGGGGGGASWGGGPITQQEYGRVNQEGHGAHEWAAKQTRSAHQEYVDKLTDQKRAEEMNQSECVDYHSDIHGGWTLDNCKEELNIFAQQNKQSIQYMYNTIGPDHNR